MDWFERLTGFRETREAVQSKLAVTGTRLTSLVNGKTYEIGELTLPRLADFRSQVSKFRTSGRDMRLRIIRGDVRQLHMLPDFEGALFQVASQFNALEMISPDRRPEDGVTIYQGDLTQGPACAMAAGAATIYRNYFAPVGPGLGQTEDRQIDTLSDLRDVLARAMSLAPADLWTMRNGYLQCDRASLDAICAYIASLHAADLELLRGTLRVALHSNVEVTAGRHPGPLVHQVFCSALPIAYSQTAARHWRPFASLILDAAYEATVLIAAINASRRMSPRVLLTLLGGGVFGNEEDLILGAMKRSLLFARPFGLDVAIVSYGEPTPKLVDLVASLY